MHVDSEYFLFIDVCILYIASQRLSNRCSGIMIAPQWPHWSVTLGDVGPSGPVPQFPHRMCSLWCGHFWGCQSTAGLSSGTSIPL